jgi:Putative Ig domain
MFRPLPRARLRIAVTGLTCVVLVSLAPRRLIAACAGDCNKDGVVGIGELLQGINIALGNLPATDCPAVNADGNESVTIDELVAAVNAALIGCPLNHAPEVSCFGIYEAYPGNAIGLPVDAIDEDGDRLRYTATDLPDGAVLDERTGVLSWTPTAQQFGTFYVPFTVTDDGSPPQTTDGLLTFKVSPQDFCRWLTCDPAAGCQSTLLPLTQACCVDLPPRVAEPLAPCPQGRALFVGRNTASGFGRIRDCDRLQVVNSAQTSATVRLNLEARCINGSEPVTIRVRLSTKSRLVFDVGVPSLLDPDDDGYAQRTTLAFPVQTPGPFFDLEGSDADLLVSMTDVDGLTISTRLRPTLTFDRLDDLEDIDAAPPQEQMSCP